MFVNGRIQKSRWVKDIDNMHRKFGVHDWVQTADSDQLRKFLEFRLAFLQEELDETVAAAASKDDKEVVDGLIDLCVIAIGTLNAFRCDADGSWDEVHCANMDKEVGVKESRPNPLGLPDLIKPEGWEGPNHNGRTGMLKDLFDADRSD